MKIRRSSIMSFDPEKHRPNVSGPDMDDLLMEAEDELMPVLGSPRQIGAEMYEMTKRSRWLKK
jgi:hypothetical protein